MAMRCVPSFFLTTTTCVDQGELDGLMTLRSSILRISALMMSLSMGETRHGIDLTGLASPVSRWNLPN